MSSAERKLAAIMFTDIVGYSALTQRDEKLALRVLDKHNQIIRSILSKHSGIEIKTIGDSFLVEFNSALGATECAIELQEAFFEENKNSANGLLVRIGIHAGDVVHRGNDVFGDAVNVASRIEPLSKGGGICISEQVHAQVINKIPLKVKKLEPRQLKNISIPVAIYEIEMPWEVKKMESRSLDMQRLAVLPFANISPDPNDEYFADGLTEELISRLSLIKGLKVIARTSMMKYKGKEKGISEIGEELGAGVIVEGSVRKAGNRIRVTVQVINSNTEEHLWASNYDNTLDDIFAVQAEIASKVSDSLPLYVPQSRPAVQAQAETRNVPAYTFYLKALQHYNEGSDDSIRKAVELFNNAIKLDPAFAQAYVGIGNCYALLGIRSYVSQQEGSDTMKLMAEKALEIDPNLAEAHALLSFYGWAMDDFKLAEEEAQRALELNPSLPDVQFNLARLRMTHGYPRSALKLLEAAYSLDPLSGNIIRYYGLMLSWLGRDSEAQDLWKKNLKVSPFEIHVALAEYELGKRNLEKADEEIRVLETLSPTDFNTISSRAFLQAMKGDKEGMAKTVELLGRSFKGGATFERTLGYLRFLTGDMDGFFEAMSRSIDEHTFDPMRMRYSPTFEKARRDPRFGELLDRNRISAVLKEPL